MVATSPQGPTSSAAAARSEGTEAIAPRLVPLCQVDLRLSPSQVVGSGPSGHRIVVGIESMDIHGERLTAKLAGPTAADWLTLSGTTAVIDVRATVVTHDGALIYIQYHGRSDTTNGFGTAPVFVAVHFETGDERYRWLNSVQAVGRGELAKLRYDWYELA